MQSIKFYACSPSASTEIAGNWPQADDFAPGCSLPVSTYVNALSPENWDATPPSITLKMNRKAKWTDLMSSLVTKVYVGMLLSKRAQAFLQDYHLSPHRWIDIDIIGSNREQRPYSILNYSSDCPAIDYPNSIFFEEVEKVEFQFDSYQNWVEQAKSLSYLPLFTPKRIALNSPIDLLKMPFRASVIVSEKLKDAIEAYPLVGFEFEPINLEVVMS